jgi:hypothetical protein
VNRAVDLDRLNSVSDPSDGKDVERRRVTLRESLRKSSDPSGPFQGDDHGLGLFVALWYWFAGEPVVAAPEGKPGGAGGRE